MCATIHLRNKLHLNHDTWCLCFIFRANLLHFPSAQEVDKEKLDGTPKLRQNEQPVRPTGPVQDAAASEDSASSVSQQRGTQGSFSPHGEVMETDQLEGLSANQEKPSTVVIERPTQSNIGIQTMDLCAPETVSAATQTVKNVCEQGTSTVEQSSGKQDATVQTERGTGEKLASAPVDDTESLHSQVGTQLGVPQGLATDSPFSEGLSVVLECLWVRGCKSEDNLRHCSSCLTQGLSLVRNFPT